jgi:hypothetical protein
MRILYVTDALAIWGGLERVLVEKANYLATHNGNEVFMLTISQGERNHGDRFLILPAINEDLYPLII